MSTDVKELAQIWDTVLLDLKNQMVKDTFNKWLFDTNLLRLDGNTAVVAVRDKYALAWLDSMLKETVRRTLGAVMKGITGDENDIDISFVVSNGNGQSQNKIDEQEPVNISNKRKSKPAKQKIRPVKRNNHSSRDSASVPDDNGSIRISHKDHIDAALNGHVRVSNYVVRFWKPYLGRTAFDLWLALSAYEHYVREDPEEKWPTNASLMRNICIKNRTVFNQAVERLESEGVFDLRVENYGTPRAIYHFDNFIPIRNAGFLTWEQHLLLEEKMDRKEHIDWLNDYHFHYVNGEIQRILPKE